jgi:hypothetical protein
MKPIHIIASAAFGFCFYSAHAASYTSDFSSLGVGASLAGIDGWQQSEANSNDGVEDYLFNGVQYLSKNTTATTRWSYLRARSRG